MTQNHAGRLSYQEMLSDPLIRLVMASDGVTVSQFVTVLETARAALAARRQSRPPAAPDNQRRADHAILVFWRDGGYIPRPHEDPAPRAEAWPARDAAAQHRRQKALAAGDDHVGEPAGLPEGATRGGGVGEMAGARLRSACAIVRPLGR